MIAKDIITTPMASLTLKGMPDALLDRLRESAETDRRSVNQQAISILDHALSLQRPGDFGRFLDGFYEKWGEGDLTDSDFEGLRPTHGFLSDAAS